jgi:hypothetical protein
LPSSQNLEKSGTYQPEEVSPIHHPSTFLNQSTRGFRDLLFSASYLWMREIINDPTWPAWLTEKK